MKVVVATLSLLLALTASVFAQGGGCLSGGPDAVKVDSFQVSLSFSAATTSPSLSGEPSSGDASTSTSGMKAAPASKSGGLQVTLDVFVWSIQGQPAISISDGSVKCTGDPTALNNISAAELFSMLTQAAIGKAIARGDIACTPDCSTGKNIVQIIQPACVYREPSSDGMTFNTCDIYACCMKTYIVCCPDGGSAPLVKEIASKSSGCGNAQCESTCQ